MCGHNTKYVDIVMSGIGGGGGGGMHNMHVIAAMVVELKSQCRPTHPPPPPLPFPAQLSYQAKHSNNQEARVVPRPTPVQKCLVEPGQRSMAIIYLNM